MSWLPRILALILSLLSLLAIIWVSRIRIQQQQAQLVFKVECAEPRPISKPESADDLVIAVISSVETVQRAIAVENTWKRRSPSQVIFFIAGPAPTLPDPTLEYPSKLPTNYSQDIVFPTFVSLDVTPQHNHLILHETAAALRYLWKMFPEKKWFMKCDDDTFVIVPNLLRALSFQNASEELFLGRTIFNGDLNSGGAGYLLSRPAMAKLMTSIDECEAAVSPDSGEDSFVAGCLRDRQGIKPSLQVGHYFSHVHHAITLQRSEHPEGLVPFPISFHWIQAQEMYTYDYLLFHAKVVE